MKAKILNNGGYAFFEMIDFPIVVNCEKVIDECQMIDIKGEEFNKLGANVTPNKVFSFFLKCESDAQVEAELFLTHT